MSVNLIYGKPGSGKSKMVRSLLNETNGYSFRYEDTFSQQFCDKGKAIELYEFLTGKTFTEDMSIADQVMFQFSYEVLSILDMDEPFKTLFFDGLPSSFDETIFENILGLISYLSSQGFTVYFVTSREHRKERFDQVFKDSYKMLSA